MPAPASLQGVTIPVAAIMMILGLVGLFFMAMTRARMQSAVACEDDMNDAAPNRAHIAYPLGDSETPVTQKATPE